MNRLTATLITLNEERNLPRALESLAGVADEIVVVDSGSKDHTCELAGKRDARVFSRAFTDYSDQKNFAAAQASHDWILSLDADEELSRELREALVKWKRQRVTCVAYACARRAEYLGRWVRHSGWYPDFKTRLYRRDAARFVGRVHESVQAEGKVARLTGDLLHHAYGSAAEHAAKIETYTTLAAEQLFSERRRTWLTPMLFGPPWAFAQKFALQLGFLDGTRGFLIARMSARYVYVKYRKLGALVRASREASRTAPKTGGIP